MFYLIIPILIFTIRNDSVSERSLGVVSRVQFKPAATGGHYFLNNRDVGTVSANPLSLRLSRAKNTEHRNGSFSCVIFFLINAKD